MWDEHKIYTIRVEKFDDFIKCLECFGSIWLFRGHTDAEWSLSTSLERAYKDYYKETEKNLEQSSSEVYKQFMKLVLPRLEYENEIAAIKKYQRLANLQEPQYIVEILARMQHYGTPTRLLDVTPSFLLALFFAFDGYSEKDRAVWAFRKPFFYDTSELAKHNKCVSFDDPENGAEKYEILLSNKESLYEACLRETENYFYSEEPHTSSTKKVILPLQVMGNNPRLIAQNGEFLCPSTLDTFENHLLSVLGINKTEYDESTTKVLDLNDVFGDKFPSATVIKMVFPIAFRHEAEKLLTAANLSARSVYPDEIGLAKSIRYW